MLITTLGITVPAQAGIVSGLSEFYIPMAADQIWDIFEDNDNNPDLIEATGIHYAIGLTASTDNTNIFYDHWEDGYDFDTTDLTGADETYAASQGEVLTFESSNVPNNPRGTTLAACSGSSNPNGSTSNCYDGRDRIYVVGGVATVTLAVWPQSIGTVYAFSFELYPTKPYQTSYIIPVGEDMAPSYDDFDNVYVTVQATEDGTTLQIDDPGTGGIEIDIDGSPVSDVLDKGGGHAASPYKRRYNSNS